MKTRKQILLGQVDLYDMVVTYPIRTRGHYTYYELREQGILKDSSPEAYIIRKGREEYLICNRYEAYPYTFTKKGRIYH